MDTCAKFHNIFTPEIPIEKYQIANIFVTCCLVKSRLAHVVAAAGLFSIETACGWAASFTAVWKFKEFWNIIESASYSIL